MVVWSTWSADRPMLVYTNMTPPNEKKKKQFDRMGKWLHTSDGSYPISPLRRAIMECMLCKCTM